jgi:hypothetical protein
VTRNNNEKSPQINEAMELGHLWQNHVLGAPRRRWRRIGLSVLVSALIVGALFVDDDLAWTAAGVMVDVFNDAADDILDALGV